jgi:hypothetical protein
MYKPSVGAVQQAKGHTAPLRDSVNILFDLAIDSVNKSEKQQGRKLAFMMRKQDEELTAQQLWKKYNMCPHCRLTLTVSGFCDECGYQKPKGTCNNCAYNQEGVCLNRQGIEGQKVEVIAPDRCNNWVRA